MCRVYRVHRKVLLLCSYWIDLIRLYYIFLQTFLFSSNVFALFSRGNKRKETRKKISKVALPLRRGSNGFYIVARVADGQLAQLFFSCRMDGLTKVGSRRKKGEKVTHRGRTAAWKHRCAIWRWRRPFLHSTFWLTLHCGFSFYSCTLPNFQSLLESASSSYYVINIPPSYQINSFSSPNKTCSHITR